MANNISSAYISTFENNVRHLVQQKESKLLNTVQSVNITGENHAWERLGLMEASLKGGFNPNVIDAGTIPIFKSPGVIRQDTPMSDAEWSRRISLVNTYNVGTSTELEDPTKMIVDPNSNLTMAISAAMKRQQDDIIIDAARGTALDGAGALNTLPASQEVDHTGQPITVKLMADIQTQFMDNHIDPDVQKFAVVPPSAVATLMQEAKSTSNDFVQASVLQQYGIVRNWMGFDWMISTRLPEYGTLPTDDIAALFYTKQAIGCQINRDIQIKMAEDPTRSFMWIIYAYMILGAVRIEDEHIIQVRMSKLSNV